MVSPHGIQLHSSSAPAPQMLSQAKQFVDEENQALRLIWFFQGGGGVL